MVRTFSAMSALLWDRSEPPIVVAYYFMVLLRAIRTENLSLQINKANGTIKATSCRCIDPTFEETYDNTTSTISCFDPTSTGTIALSAATAAFLLFRYGLRFYTKFVLEEIVFSKEGAFGMIDSLKFKHKHIFNWKPQVYFFFLPSAALKKFCSGKKAILPWFYKQSLFCRTVSELFGLERRRDMWLRANRALHQHYAQHVTEENVDGRGASEHHKIQYYTYTIIM